MMPSAVHSRSQLLFLAWVTSAKRYWVILAKRRSRNGHRPSSLRDAKGFLVTGHGQFLLQALAAAVDVVSATERYAAACGLELQFTGEDLREIGLSIYTSGTK